MPTLLEYKCPCCSGSIEFNSSLQKLKCPYCDTEFDADALRDFSEQPNAEDKTDWESVPDSRWEDGEADGFCTYVCNSCGGAIICDGNTAALRCPYCDNAVVIGDRLFGELKPDYIIPFKLDKNAAKDGLMRYFKGKRLLPRVFKDENHIDEIKGIYVPFWLFDTSVAAEMSYKTSRVHRWSDSKYDYIKTDFYSVHRGGNMSFEHVPVDGSSKMPDNLMESLEPFDFSAAVEFKAPYLAGFTADKYDVSAEQSIERANERISNSAKQVLTESVIGYSSVMPIGGNVRFSGGSSKYALYPIWLLNTTYKQKKYVFAMNGQTGKFTGNLPVDKKAYARWLCGLTAAIGAAVFAVSYIVWML